MESLLATNDIDRKVPWALSLRKPTGRAAAAARVSTTQTARLISSDLRTNIAGAERRGGSDLGGLRLLRVGHGEFPGEAIILFGAVPT